MNSGYHMSQHVPHRHSASPEGQEYHQHHHAHAQGPPPQHGIPMMHRLNMPQPFYVVEQTNPGIATMSTTTVQQPYSIPRQHVDRATIEVPYSASSMASLSGSPRRRRPCSPRPRPGTSTRPRSRWPPSASCLPSAPASTTCTARPRWSLRIRRCSCPAPGLRPYEPSRLYTSPLLYNTVLYYDRRLFTPRRLISLCFLWLQGRIYLIPLGFYSTKVCFGRRGCLAGRAAAAYHLFLYNRATCMYLFAG